jgi:hypothetical protein
VGLKRWNERRREKVAEANLEAASRTLREDATVNVATWGPSEVHVVGTFTALCGKAVPGGAAGGREPVEELLEGRYSTVVCPACRAIVAGLSVDAR